MECLRLSEPDYIAELTVNLNASKFEIQTKFNSIKANLDLQERFIIDQLNAIYSENLKSIQELQECRTQTLESKVTLSESMQNSNHLKLLSQNFDSTIENLNSQIQNLTRIKFSWNIPNDLENLIHIDGSATNVKIDKQVTKGEGPGQLSGFLQAMKVYKEKIYVADNKANAIKIFTRKGDMLDSYTHTKLRNPLSMTIDRRYLYVLTKINLFKISTIDLDTLSIVKLNPRGYVINIYKEAIYVMCIDNNQFVIECWNSYMLKRKQITLTSPHIAIQPSIYSSQPNVSFRDMKIFNDIFYVLFKNSIYPLQAFDLNGRILSVILGEDLTHDLVGICLTLNTIILRDKTNSQILIFSNQGKLIRTIESENTPYGLKSPMCMDIDERGNLVVCDGKDNWMLQDIPI